MAQFELGGRAALVVEATGESIWLPYRRILDAARVADLELYVLQDHGDRDLARIGRMVLERGGVAW